MRTRKATSQTLCWVRSYSTFLTFGALAAAVLSWSAWLYYPFMADDSFISLRYAERLLHGQGLTWTDGERVEGYSNLLWVLACALLGAPGLDLVFAARLLGWLCSMAMLGAIVYSGSRIERSRDTAFGTLLALLAVAASGSAAAWTVGGLEQPMLAALVAWSYALGVAWIDRGLVWSRRQTLLLGVLLGLLCWTRPDAPLFGALLLGCLVSSSALQPRAVKACLRAGLIALAFVIAQLGFRRVYYGEWVANTALVKLSWTAARRHEGWEYVTSALTGMMPLLLLTSPCFVAARRDRRRWMIAGLLGTAAVAWCSYVAVIGGDIFPAHRHFVVIMPLVALMILQSNREMRRWGPAGSRAWKLTAAACIALFAWRQAADVENGYAHGERWEWDAVATGRLLREHFGPTRPLLAADAAGALVYFSGLRALDMLGLNDRYLAKHPPPDFGTGRLAHELGDGRYVLRRRPDMVIFNAPTGDHGGVWRSGKEMGHSSEFHDHYRHVLFETDDPRGKQTHVFVRLDGRVGMRQGAGLVIPGYFWGNSADVTARTDQQGRLGAVLHSHLSTKLQQVALPSEPHGVVVRSTGEPITVTLRCGEQMRSSADAPLVTWACSHQDRFTIELQGIAMGLTHVREVEFVPCTNAASRCEGALEWP